MLSSIDNMLKNTTKCFAEIHKVKKELTGTIQDVIFDEKENEPHNIMDTFFDSYENSYSLTLAYPRELFEQAAEKANIDHTQYETKELVEKLYKEGVL